MSINNKPAGSINLSSLSLFPSRCFPPFEGEAAPSANPVHVRLSRNYLDSLPYCREQPLSFFSKFSVSLNPEERSFFDYDSKKDRRHQNKQKYAYRHPVKKINGYSCIGDDHSRIGWMPCKTVWSGSHNSVLRNRSHSVRIENRPNVRMAHNR